ncbi:uncharacterized protein LOC131165087 isoform X2 [Malania oleifera]|uniref:uncharacterized protein LOC131165087 isoform X2 n=1 Tax=Malania oleifera TaxID=397392 RepID=UPI0025AE1EE1|nr:uncharacterized protein LOC131165087 isoform X2 [Malania oleifera]
MGTSSSPPDPQPLAAAASTAAATTNRQSRDPRPLIPYYTAQAQPIRVPNPSPNSPQIPKTHDPPQGVLYPVASSGRGFIPKVILPKLPDQTVTVANPAGGSSGFPSRPFLPFAHPFRPFGFPPSDPTQFQPLQLMRPPQLHHSHLASAGAAVKGVPVSAHKVVSTPSSVSDCNGYKDLRDQHRDDTIAIVKDRKVRISDGASLYALCRSWLRNGHLEEIQPQCGDSGKSLPRPLSLSAADAQLPKKMDFDEEEGEDEEEEEIKGRAFTTYCEVQK